MENTDANPFTNQEFLEKVAKFTTSARELAQTIDNMNNDQFDQWLEFLKKARKDEIAYFNILRDVMDWTDWAGRKVVADKFDDDPTTYEDTQKWKELHSDFI